METHILLGIIALSYAIGSFPTAYLVGRINGINIFEYGSGNMGATNVGRTLGTFWGMTVFMVDILKGILAVWVARQIAANEPFSTQTSVSLIAAVAVVTGHNWSLIASLISGSIKGGKGAATTAGTWIILMPAMVVAIPLIFLAFIIVTTRYMSLAVMVSSAVGGIIILAMVLAGQLETVYLLWLLMPIMVIGRHHENIKRLLAGNERRLGERVYAPNE